MSEEMYTIGELSRLSGVSVRRLRFYSDKGLLPPATRTESGYRLYSEADAARLDLIRALRGAGVGLAEIRRIVARKMSLEEVLSLRLDALEAEIAAKRRIAAVLRATLRVERPEETDLRRLWTVTTLSNTQFRALLERFYDQAAGDVAMDETWKQQMIEAGCPTLPDDPTPEQIDAWTELAAILSDTAYVAEMKAEMARLWTGDFDAAAYAQASDAILARVTAAIGRGLPPTSSEGAAIARDWLDASAKAMNRVPDSAFLRWHLDQYRKHHGRSLRYQQLLAVLRGEAGDPAAADAWRWIHEAMTPLLAETV